MFKYGYMGIDGMNQHCNAREMERIEDSTSEHAPIGHA